ncbi:phytoene/squalene synthase family protein [Halovenus rubra]|uniref:Phytoene/squalene synthase family protein n=2 Tax=Halovenus rubra TaxID=869890 RepID=A0ACC7E239_9EURY
MNESQRKRGKAIHRQTGQTFYYATRLLPERIREQTYVLYGFFRVSDEVVDGDTELPPDAKEEKLNALRAAALGEQPAEDPVVEAFSELRAETGISEHEVDAFIDAMLTDVDTDRYETFEDLREYTRGSAAAVGNMMLAIMDADEPDAARDHAMALGEAFQLTNFIRDVDEDITDLDRIYLPMETLNRYDVTSDQLRRGVCTPEFRQAIRVELSRAEQLYRNGVRGIKYLPEDCQFPVLLAAVLYAEHHRLIRAQEFDVLTTRPSLSHRRKLWTVAKTWWNWRRFRDPVSVFERVSAIPEDAESPAGATTEVEHTTASTD